MRLLDDCPADTTEFLETRIVPERRLVRYTYYVSDARMSADDPKFQGPKDRAIFEGQRVRDFEAFADQATRRLVILDSAEAFEDLSSLRSNRLELLAGDRKGQHSIRINQQWRICFCRADDGPCDVEIVDYHS